MREQDCGSSRSRVPTGMPAWLLTVPPTWLGDDAAPDDAAPQSGVPVLLECSDARGGDNPCVPARRPAHDCQPASTGLEEAGSGVKLDVSGASATVDGHPLHRVCHLASPDTSSSCHSLDNTLVAKGGLSGRTAVPASPKQVVLPSHQVGDFVQSDWQTSKESIVQPLKLEPVCDLESGTLLGTDVQLAQQEFEGGGLLSICDILTFGIDPEAQGLWNFNNANSSTQSSAQQDCDHDIDRSVYNEYDICELLSYGGDRLELQDGNKNTMHNVTVIAT